jgi:hypothetical protein
MNNSNFLMSDELLSQIDLSEQVSSLISDFVLFYIRDDSNKIEISGPVFSTLFAEDPEVEVKVNLPTALKVLKHQKNLVFNDINIMHKEDLATVKGTFTIHAAKIFDIKVDQQSCILAIGFKRQSKD